MHWGWLSPLTPTLKAFWRNFLMKKWNHMRPCRSFFFDGYAICLGLCTWVPCPAELSATYLTRYCRSSSRGSSSGKDPWGQKLQSCKTLLRVACSRNLWKYWYCLKWLWLTSRIMKMLRFAFQSFSCLGTVIWSWALSHNWQTSHVTQAQNREFCLSTTGPNQLQPLLLVPKVCIVYCITISVCFSVSVYEDVLKITHKIATIQLLWEVFMNSR